METITARVESDTYEEISDTAEERDVSKSKVVRELVEKGIEYEELQADNESLQARVEELRNELAAANRRIDSANELVEYVEENRSVEQRRRKAGIVTRTKWWLTGMPDEE